METEKLYYKDAYLKNFNAAVLDCRSGGKGYIITLSQTAFYPEGGGQPSDTGFLRPVNGSDAVRVLEVHEKDKEILHYTDMPLEKGTEVYGEIDWQRRFDLMQQHSGEHIVSGIVHAEYGYDNVGFHLGSDVITVDFNGELNEDQLKDIELKANEAVWANQKTHIFYPSDEELKTLPYRSKKELTGAIRIVEFPDASGSWYDLCACCGTHVAQAGEIGIIKLLSVVGFREGVRMEMICGKRALDYLNAVNEQNHRISVMLSAKPADTAEAVRKNIDENYRLNGRIIELEEEMFAREADRLSSAGNVLLFEKNMNSDSVRKLAVAVMETCKGLCAVFSDNGDGSYKYAIGEKDRDLRALVKEMNQTLDGRGGGKPFFAQGLVKADERMIRDFFHMHQMI